MKAKKTKGSGGAASWLAACGGQGTIVGGYTLSELMLLPAALNFVASLPEADRERFLKALRQAYTRPRRKTGANDRR